MFLTKKVKILIGVDQKDVALGCQKVLEERGHTCEVTYDAQQCLNRYSERLHMLRVNSDNGIAETKCMQPYDMVIVDYGKKEADDLQVGDSILAWNPRQRVIITTGNIKASVEELIKETESSIDKLEKPYPDTQIQELVEQAAIASQ
jgi:CheY-like chemotaxis protein